MKVLATGRPGVGKTTLVERVLERLRLPAGVEASGFTTAEVRKEGRRVGFRFRTLDGAEGWLARAGLNSRRRVGRYGVCLEEFEEGAVGSVDPERTAARLVVLDEIGKMESFSRRFREAAQRLLASDRVVLATVSQTGGPWVARMREWPGARLLQVTDGNRDALVGEIAAELEGALAAS